MANCIVTVQSAYRFNELSLPVCEHFENENRIDMADLNSGTSHPNKLYTIYSANIKCNANKLL